MQQHNSLLSFILQMGAGFFFLILAFYYFDPLNVGKEEADAVNMLVYGMIVPVMFISITTAICIIAGLPFRFIPAIHRWWVARPFLQAALLFTGILLLFLSLHPAFQIHEEYTRNEDWVERSLVNENLSLTGWFLTAFCLFNTYPLVIFDRLSKKWSPKTFI